jgi:fatty-acyl-CoA synthase
MRAAIATLADVEARERVPFAERVAWRSTYEMLADVAGRFPAKPALRYVESGEPGAIVRDLTFSQVRDRVTQAANLFRELGAAPGGAVSSLLPNVPEAFLAMFGGHAAAAANPINYLLEPAHIAALLREACCRVLVAPDPALAPDVWAKVAAIRAEVPTLAHVLRVGGPPERPGSDAADFATLLAKRPTTLAFERAAAPDETAALFHTGGTTSAPKLARHTQRGLAYAAWTNAEVLALDADDVLFNGLPPFHVGGAYCAGLGPLSRGATVVQLTAAGLRNRDVIAHFWALVERFRATVLAAVPTGWSAILSVPSDGYDLSSVRLCNSGGSTLPLDIAREIGARLGTPVVEGWGMTEIHGFGSMNPAAGECRIGSVGLRAPYLELVAGSVADGRLTRRCATDEIGHILARGAQLFGGYAGAGAGRDARVAPLADETVPAWSPGGAWLDTGDLGRIDAAGYVWLTGRAKDLIVRGGHNIDPLVIEHALESHPAVEMAAAVGRPDAYAGELPMCFVALRPGADASPDELREHARARVSERAAAPVEVVVLERLPVTAVGKIFKPELREIAIRMTLERIVALHAPAGAVVTVGAHAVHGTFADVELSTALDAPADAHLRADLDALAVRYALRLRSDPARDGGLGEREGLAVLEFGDDVVRKAPI